ncbi:MULTISPECIES: HD-GYP domain-containing protein [unclassified Candidatus Frackibacter]|uniref:HD-GYP domain-containing protein n=1 Tax=unclassified Candidatus Frackibacter TaxID=2648818 RepID=UPI0008CEE509|nr:MULTISPECIES: HD domain-containing phosphohydrolase [unclassified Candidatus Frackibacter]SEM35816.1 HD-GYP domain, c-di-GMP phosphodiesterase class II (or its inactivated variant) [Candidatus Frackibacter sp. WG12]SFL40997.1 HD-GYP domain, c-di-GMP phosphodiesterase class II (or its inactivated variant) [Candidatus Frackibacter sp. WG13]
MEKIKTENLTPGMILVEPVIAKKNDRVLLRSGVKLTSKRINAIRKLGVEEVAIASQYTLLTEPETTTIKELNYLIKREIRRLAPDDPEANTSDQMVEVSKKARAITDKILRSEEVIKFSIRMKILDNEFFFKHSVITCALSLLVAGAMNLSDKDLFRIGTAALLHDLGLGEMPFLIKPEAPEEPDNALWKEHPTYGYYLAKEAGVSRKICRLIRLHHEKWNGSGFPKGLQGEEIPLGARIISLCETYDTLTRHNSYPPHEAIEYFYGTGDVIFDSNVVKAFTNNIAVYPLGSLVRLSNKEVGVVVNVRKNKGPRPIVRVYYNSVNRRLENPKIIDLGEEKTTFITEVL